MPPPNTQKRPTRCVQRTSSEIIAGAAFEPRASGSRMRTSAGSDKVMQTCSVGSCERLTRREDGLCAFHAETARRGQRRAAVSVQ